VRKAELYPTQAAMSKTMSDRNTLPDVEWNGQAEKNWFAVFTVPRHEKRIEAQFGLRGIENFLPMYEKQRRWKDGSKGMLQLPLFSSYIFARIGCGERVHVLKVPGVISIVGCGPQPLPVADSYIHFLREGLRCRRIEPCAYLKEGMRVRIHSGMMAGMEGVLLRQKNNLRVVLTLEMIMKSVIVEVDLEEIEPVVRIPGGSAVQFAASA
jgi:transcription antitermination factor NusG